jgi:hypothetical protein
MKPVRLALILALPTIVACQPSNPRAVSASHPPAADLVCPAEPDVAAMLSQDPTGLQFDMAVREAGQGCREALARVCRWHKERGADVVCPKP